jgi:DNA repair protein RadC
MEVCNMLQQTFLPSGGRPYRPIPKVRLLSLRETPAYRVSNTPLACTTVELLAAVVGGPQQIEIAEALSAHFRGDLRRLHNAPAEEIASIHGIGTATAARLKAAMTLAARLTAPGDERITINSPADAAALVHTEMAMLEAEHLRVILLNTRNQVLEIVEVYKGSVNSSQVRLSEAFRPAIQRNASSVIFVHNHPSTDPTPSPDDVAITRALVQAGRLMDIEVLDHLIIGSRWVSLKERGLGFS